MDIIGIDVGFGFTKATNGRDLLIFKSLLGEAAEIQYRERLLDEADREEHLHLEVDGESYFIGELAERQSHTRFFTLDQTQFVSHFTKVLAFAALSRLSTPNVPVRLVTGLPVVYYQRHGEDLGRMLLGKHELTVVDEAGERKELSLNVDKVRVVPQPFGSLFNLMLDDSGEAGERRFLEEKIGVIDVGFRTADFTISDRTRYSQRGSDTTESGITQAFNTIAAKLQEKSGVNVELYRLFDAVARGTIKIRGKKYELKTITDQVFKQLASSISTEVDRLWTDDWDIDVIMVTGGGGAVLAPHLEPLLNGEVLPLKADEDYRFNNVRGYWKYGKNLWARGAKPAG